MRSWGLIVCLAALPAALPALDFVGVDGTAFVAGGRRLALRGEDVANAADAFQHLAGARDKGVNLLQIRVDGLAQSSAPGIPSEAGWRQLDQVLATAAKAGVYILPSLSSFRSGGGAARLSKGLGGTSSGLYLADGRARQWYLFLLAQAGNRRNTVTGVAYKDDPAIFGWCLGADLGDPDDPLGERAGNWARRSAAVIKQADPRHLVGVHFVLEVPPALGKAAALDFLALPENAGPAAGAELARPLLLVGGDGSWYCRPDAKPLRLGPPSVKLTGPHDARVAVRASEDAVITVDYGNEGWLKDSVAAPQGKTAILDLKGLRDGGRYLLRLRARTGDGRVAASSILRLDVPGEARLPAAPAPWSGSIVTAEEGQFRDAGKPFRYVGANNYYLRITDDDAAFAQVLDSARDMGMRVLRCQANGELVEPVKPDIFEPQRWMVAGSPQGWQEASWKRYDRVLAECQKRGLRVIIYITDNWEYFGGMKTWAKWRGIDDKNAFFTNSTLKDDYKGLIRRWATRVNTVTGVKYADDPTIFAWELANEPRDESDKSSRTLASWVDEMAGFFKSLDPKHMVACGLEGMHALNGEHYSGADFVEVQKSKNVDFATFHFYPIKDFRRFSLKAAKGALRDYVATAHAQLGKPVVMEEFGIEKKYDGDLNRFEWTQSLAETFLRAGGDGLNYWMLVDDHYLGGDGFEIQPQDVGYCNLFSRLATAMNNGRKL